MNLYRSTTLFSALALAATAGFGQGIPNNDDCAGAFPVFAGTNPNEPNGASGIWFSNVGATDSGGFGSCPASFPVTPYQDVYFAYEALQGGPTTVATCTPPGFFPGSLSDTVLAVYASVCGATPILAACNDDAPCGGVGAGLLSSANFFATAGTTYLIRVGSYAASPSYAGGFYLTITPPPSPSNDDCAAAAPADLGATPSSTIGTVLSAGPAGCGVALHDVWFAYYAGATCVVDASIGGPGAGRVEVYSGACGATTSLGCDAASVSFLATAGQSYLIRVGSATAATRGIVYLYLSAPPPANDGCGGAIALQTGVNPAAPYGASGATFNNCGATDSPYPVSPCLGAGFHDVFFRWTALSTSNVAITTSTPPGFAPGTLTSTLLEVRDTTCLPSYPFVCDFGSANDGMSVVAFAAVAGTTYEIRVLSVGPFDLGSFYVTVDPTFTMTFSQPLGAGSIAVTWGGGVPGEIFLSAFTLVPGAFPNGYWFGLDPTVPELFVQIQASGALPFGGLLDAGGGAAFGPLTGLFGLTLYGVAIELLPTGAVREASAPVSIAL